MNITVQELKAKMDAQEDFVLIDVREPFEYEEFNLGGELIPLGIVPVKLMDIAHYKDKEVIVHCKMGGRSAMAQKILLSNGFQNVKNLTGGVTAWKNTFGVK